MRQTAMSAPRRVRYLDLGFYLVCAAFAGLSAVWSEFFGYRVWGALSLVGYLFGLGQAVAGLVRPGARGWWASRRIPIWLIAIMGFVVPLVALLITRLHGVLWSEQPEVWVVERSTTLLFHHGTPYTDLATLGRPPIVDDYTPYGPVMTVFGLPRALLGAVSPLGDARIAFAVGAMVVVAVALRVAGRPVVPVRALQLVVAGPLTVLTAATAGDDIAVVALILLALALLHARRPVACAVVITIAVSMKLTAVVALVVLAVAVLAMLGRRALAKFGATVVGVGAVLNVPVLLVDPTSFVEHVIRFPIGLGRAHSPAASPLPGNLIARLGPVGHDVSLALLLAGGVAMAVWLVRRPPRTTADAALRIAVGLAGAIMLAPATRWGYLVYPVVLLGAAIALRAARTAPVPEVEPAAVN
ncbi:MAG TPA: glycosyltransferase 87 family protein [Pseudonocardiaceae bacterium]|nr:glycosyltransferase 87 family protein [Pseudonocardiaceae bacterium]